MRNTLLSITQIGLFFTTAERGGTHPGGDWRPEARHDLKTGAPPHHSSQSLVKRHNHESCKARAFVERLG